MLVWPVAPTAAQTFEWTYQFVGSQQINGVAQAPDTGTTVVVNAAGEIYTSSDGASWSLRHSGSAALNAVAVADGQTFLAVGAGGVVLRSVDGGQSWTAQDSGTLSNLYGVAAVSPTEAWAVGDDRLSSSSALLRTTDGGLTWQAYNSNTQQVLWAVAAAGPVLWASGSSGHLMRWDGSRWTVQTPGTTAALRGVVALDSLTAFAVGTSGTILRTTTGSDWLAQNSPVTDRDLLAVAAADERRLWAVGLFGLALSTDDGVTWRQEALGRTETLRGVWVGPDGTVWAGGASGILLRRAGSATPTPTDTENALATATPLPTDTPTTTVTPDLTETPIGTATSDTPTSTPAATDTPTTSPTRTDTPISSPTRTPTATTTATSTATHSPTSTSTTTATPSPWPTATITPTPTVDRPGPLLFGLTPPLRPGRWRHRRDPRRSVVPARRGGRVRRRGRELCDSRR